MKTAQLRLAVLAAPIILGMVGCAGGGHRTSTSVGNSESPMPPERMVAIARTFERQGRTDKAREIYAGIAAEHPAHAEAARRLQLIAARERQLQQRATAQSLIADTTGAPAMADAQLADAAAPKVLVAPPVPSKEPGEFVPQPALASTPHTPAESRLESQPVEAPRVAAVSSSATPDQVSSPAPEVVPQSTTPTAPAVIAEERTRSAVAAVEREAPKPAASAGSDSTGADATVADSAGTVAFTIETSALAADERAAEFVDPFEPPVVEPIEQVEPVQQTATLTLDELTPQQTEAFEPPLEINPVRRAKSAATTQEPAASAPIVIVAARRADRPSADFLSELKSAVESDASETAVSVQLASGLEDKAMPIELQQIAFAVADPEVATLIDQLSAGDSELRRAAAARLAGMGKAAKPAIPALEQALNDSNLFVQAHASRALWEIDRRGDVCLPVLSDLLETSKPEVHAVAAYVLGCMGPDARPALPGLRRIVSEGSGSARLHAAEAVLKIEPEDRAAADVLVGLLTSEAAELRWLAAFALGACGEEESRRIVPELLEALDDRDVRVQAAAVLTLGSFGSTAEPALKQLATLADSEDAHLREAALIAAACISAG